MSALSHLSTLSHAIVSSSVRRSWARTTVAVAARLRAGDNGCSPAHLLRRSGTASGGQWPMGTGVPRVAALSRLPYPDGPPAGACAWSAAAAAACPWHRPGWLGRWAAGPWPLGSGSQASPVRLLWPMGNGDFCDFRFLVNKYRSSDNGECEL